MGNARLLRILKTMDFTQQTENEMILSPLDACFVECSACGLFRLTAAQLPWTDVSTF